MEWIYKHFAELTGTEMYEILQLRNRVFVVEQNRDAQMHSLLVNEFEIDPAHLIKVLHYDGTPITARFICDAIRKRLEANAQPQRSQMAKESA